MEEKYFKKVEILTTRSVIYLFGGKALQTSLLAHTCSFICLMKGSINMDQRGMDLVEMIFLQSISSTILMGFRVLGKIAASEDKLESIVVCVCVRK